MSATTVFVTYRQVKGPRQMDDIFGPVETLLKGSSPTERERFLYILGLAHSEPWPPTEIDPTFVALSNAPGGSR